MTYYAGDYGFSIEGQLPSSTPQPQPGKLSRPMRRALDHMAEVGAKRLYRWPGGFWMTESPPADIVSIDPLSSRRFKPLHGGWWIATAVVKALERRGLLRRVGTYKEEWRDTRELVP